MDMSDEKKTDLRIRRTKRAIKEAFFKLIEQKGFEKITVKDITDEAMISRNTFYLHYSDKYDLLNKISASMIKKVFLAVSKRIETKTLDYNIESAAFILQVAQRVIDDDRDIYRLLLLDPGTVIFGDKIEQCIRFALDIIKDDIDGISDLSIEYIVTGIKGIVRYWVTHENIDVQKESYNFAKIHLASLLEIIKRNKDIKHKRLGRTNA